MKLGLNWKEHLIAASTIFTPWVFAWYALDEIRRCLEEIGSNCIEYDEAAPVAHAPSGPPEADGVWINADLFNLRHRSN